MSRKTLFNDFSNWAAWDKHREKCRELHKPEGYKPRTINTLKNKAKSLREELHALENKIKEKCSHPLEFQAVRSRNTSICEWNEHWVKVYSCELCNQDLAEEKDKD
jgi:hypothetical protein